MSAVIRLDRVLQDATALPYRDLITRPTGQAVRQRLVMVLREVGATYATLDFSAVGLVDYSCADEIVAKLLAASVEPMPCAGVVLRGLREDHVEAIDHALSRHGLVVAAFATDATRPVLLGEAADDWRLAFAAVADLGRAAATRVADHLAWPAARTAIALDALVTMRCLRCHPDATYELGATA
ncbi:MAG TPA: hypothetical protein VFN90_09200 [Gemmatimonadales bacterium]|nr:hypothetical protein [Gemmatimonadales bacterium]